MTALGAAASAAQLASQVRDILANMWQYFEAVKDAPKRSHELRQEIGNISHLLESLDDSPSSPALKSIFTDSKSLEEFRAMIIEMNSRVAVTKTKGTGRLKWPPRREQTVNLQNREVQDNLQHGIEYLEYSGRSVM